MKNLIIIILVLLSCGFSQRQNNWQGGQVELDSIPLTAYEYKERGKRKSANGDNRGAIDDYSRAIMVKPMYDTAYHNRGVVKAILGYYEDAILDYDKAIEINPHLKVTYFSRANAKVNLGDNKEVLSDFSKAIRLDSLYIDPYINRALLKSKMKDYEGELSDYRLAIRYCEPDSDIYNNLGRAKNESASFFVYLHFASFFHIASLISFTKCKDSSGDWWADKVKPPVFKKISTPPSSGSIFFKNLVCPSPPQKST